MNVKDELGLTWCTRSIKNKRKDGVKKNTQDSTKLFLNSNIFILFYSF